MSKVIAPTTDELADALRLLRDDVADYPAWQRPCHALDLANAMLARHDHFKRDGFDGRNSKTWDSRESVDESEIDRRQSVLDKARAM